MIIVSVPNTDWAPNFNFVIMPFFRLNFNDDLGAIPQDKGIAGSYNVNAPDSLRNFAYSDKKVGLWIPDGINLRHQAKFTDMLDFSDASYPYLVVSDRFLSLLTSFRLPEYQVFPLNVFKKEKVVRYNIFISKQYFAEYVDFEHSEFFTFEYDTKTRTPVQFKNSTEFWDLYHKMNEHIYLKGAQVNLNTNAVVHDLFRLPRGLSQANYCVSEPLANAVIQAKLTGVKFEEYSGMIW